MTESIFQIIYNIIEPTLPNNWERVVLFSAFTPGSSETKYFVKKYNEEGYLDCFALMEDGQDIFPVLFEIYTAISKERETNINDNQKWTVMIITIEADGNFESVFDYSDDYKNNEAYKDQWAKKYLK